MDLKKYRIVLPGMITSVSILCGLFAIFFTLTGHDDGGYFTTSCWLIIFAAVIDGIDGKVARMTRSSSEFGIQYDSMADIITFGVAAAVVMFRQIYIDLVEVNPAYYLLPIAFALCGAIRLARFNTQATTGAKKCFYGLPIPTAAGAIMSLFLLFNALEYDYGIALSETLKLRITSLYIVLVSLLMVSLVEYDVSGYFFFGRIRKHLVRSAVNLALFIYLFFNAGAAFALVSIFYIAYNLIRGIIRLAGQKDGEAPGDPLAQEN